MPRAVLGCSGWGSQVGFWEQDYATLGSNLEHQFMDSQVPQNILPHRHVGILCFCFQVPPPELPHELNCVPPAPLHSEVRLREYRRRLRLLTPRALDGDITDIPQVL